MGEEWEGDVEKDLVLCWYLGQSGFLHDGPERCEDVPHYLTLGVAESDIGWCGLFHGLS